MAPGPMQVNSGVVGSTSTGEMNDFSRVGEQISLNCKQNRLSRKLTWDYLICGH